MAVALGFRAKTGRAIGVALAATPHGAPELLWRGEIALIGADYPHTEGPYHPFLDLPWEEALVAIQPLIRRIEAVARAAVAPLIAEWKASAIGVVGSPDRPLDKIGNEHIRAHAAEGILFRRVLESATQHHGLSCRAFSEKELPEVAASELVKSFAAHLKVLGGQAGSPWRADERAAATAAWLALS